MNEILHWNWKKQRVLFLLVIFGLGSPVMAQQIVSGTVTDESDEGLPGVSIILKGTASGTVTDIEGAYRIEVPDNNAVLMFSSVGFLKQEIQVGNSTQLNIQLAADVTSLDEIVVVGYGTQRKQDLTGSISKVEGQAIENQPIANVGSLLNGRTAGVQVTANSGTPGGGVTVRIRGNTSLNSGNDPLYVVDGVPTGDITAFNPNDIESIEVLKDASASAIYGARAANGVVLITTKKGKAGKPVFSLSGYYGVQEVYRRLPMMNADQQYAYVVKGNDNYNRAFPSAPREVRPDHTIDYNLGYDTDWQEEIFRVAPIQNYDFGARGGTDRMRYALSLGYFNQQGVIISSGYERYSSKFSFDFDLTDRIRVGASLIASRQVSDRIPEFDSEFSVLGNAIRKLAYEPVFEPDGSYSIRERANPVAQALETYFFTYTNKALGNIYLEADILKNLTFRTFTAYDYSSADTEQFKPSYILGGTTRPASISGNEDGGWLTESTLRYQSIFGDHSLSALVGYSAQESRSLNFSAQGSLGATDNIHTLNATAQADNVNSSRSAWGITSLFSRVNYSFKERYLLALSLRRDGSSRFGKDNRYGFFPAASIGWRVSEESFFAVDFFNELKFRGSFGRTGNQSIGNFAAQGVYNTGSDYAGNPGVRVGNIPVYNLTWETTDQVDIGADMRFLSDRIGFTFDAYIKKTTGLLFNVPLPQTTGFGSSLQNLGEIENRGLEFNINADVIRTNNFSWNTDFNISFNRNKVLQLPEHTSLINSYSTDTYYSVNVEYITQEGQPIGMFYGYKWTGEIYPTDAAALEHVDKIVGRDPIGGTFKYEDISGPNGVPDRLITADDRQIIGNPHPKFTGGFNNTLKYKNFDLSIFMIFTYGNQIFNQNRMTSDRGFVYNAATTDMVDAWGEPGQITPWHKAWAVTDQMDNQRSSAWIEDGSYLRIRDLSFGYNLPTDFLSKAQISNARVYFTAYNLHTFTKYKGFDPEVNSQPGNVRTLGVDMGAYPQVRTLMMGLKLNF